MKKFADDTVKCIFLRLVYFDTNFTEISSQARNYQEAIIYSDNMMTSSNGNIFRLTGHLCGKFTGPRWLPHTKASDAELLCFLGSASE